MKHIVAVGKMPTLYSIFFLTLFIWGGCAGQKILHKNEPVGIQTDDKISERPDVRPIEAIQTQAESGKTESLKSAPVHVEDIEPMPAAKKVSPAPRFPIEEKKPKKDRGTSKPASESKAGQIVLEFDNADLYEVIRELAKHLGINYITEPGIQGTVSIHTAGYLKQEDLFPVFFQILEANGLTAVKEGSLYKIIKFKDASRMPIASRFGDAGSQIPPEDRVIIQIIPLKYISVQEVTKLLTPFISAEGTLVSHEESNTLLLVDRHVNVMKALKLVEAFDINVFEKINHRIFHLQYADAEETAKSLETVISSYGAGNKENVKILPVKRLNMLIVISAIPHVFETVEWMIGQLDVQGHDVDPRIYVYSVKNGAAEELSDLLNGVFSRGAVKQEKTETVKKEVQNEQNSQEKKPEAPKLTIDAMMGAVTSAKKPEKIAAGKISEGQGSGTLKGEVKITPDKVRNALIIEAIPKDYQIIESILKRIDVLPRQVLIEVTIAEISLDSKMEMGVEWHYVRGSGRKPSTATLNADIGAAGLQYVIGQAERWSAALSALATDKKVNILSSPTVLASDNKEANINVSTEVPVASAKYTRDDSKTIETNVQYKNTGVILSVTPHINEHGLVTMDVSQEVSEQSENVAVGENDSRPSFFKRSVKTSLTVKHGQTIVIGGLIRENRNVGFAGVPCLGNVPVLQYLFGKKSDSSDKTELIILITPRVIATLEDVDAVTEEFKSKVGNVLNRGN